MFVKSGCARASSRQVAFLVQGIGNCENQKLAGLAGSRRVNIIVVIVRTRIVDRLVGADHQPRHKLVGQTVEVLAVEFGAGTSAEIVFWESLARERELGSEECYHVIQHVGGLRSWYCKHPGWSTAGGGAFVSPTR